MQKEFGQTVGANCLHWVYWGGWFLGVGFFLLTDNAAAGRVDLHGSILRRAVAKGSCLSRRFRKIWGLKRVETRVVAKCHGEGMLLFVGKDERSRSSRCFSSSEELYCLGTLSEWKGNSRRSQRVPGYSRSSSRNSESHSQSANSILGMASRNLSEKSKFTEPFPERLPNFMGTRMKDFRSPRAFLKCVFKNWGGPRAPDRLWAPKISAQLVSSTPLPLWRVLRCGTFQKKLLKNSGKTPETHLESRSFAWSSPREYGCEPPKP